MVSVRKKKVYLTISGQKISLSPNPEILISDRTVVLFRLCGAWYRYLYLRKNHPTIKLRWWLWRNNGDFFVFVSRFRKMWLQCKIEFCVIFFRRIELENLRVFPNLTKTTKLYRIYPFPILAKYLYFSRADTCDNDGFNSFCSCTTTKILRLKIKRFFPRIISNRYIHKYMTNIYSKNFFTFDEQSRKKQWKNITFV